MAHINYSLSRRYLIAERGNVSGRFIGTRTATSGKRFEVATAIILGIANGKAAEGWIVPEISGDLCEKPLCQFRVKFYTG